ncbi:hypothetical protein L9G74_21855, partial [Shewanella sp. C32]
AIKAAHQIFLDNQDKLGALSADIRGLVLKSEVQNYGSRDLFDKLLAAYQQTADPSYKADLRMAIPTTTDLELIKLIIGHY